MVQYCCDCGTKMGMRTALAGSAKMLVLTMVLYPKALSIEISCSRTCRGAVTISGNTSSSRMLRVKLNPPLKRGVFWSQMGTM